MTNQITLRYWAAARAAAGTPSDLIATDEPLTLAALVDRACALHPDTRLTDVLAVCSALVDDEPVTRRDPAEVQVAPGQTVEFLPPFAGG